MAGFGVLGPLEVTVGGRAMRLGGRRQRTLLAVLLANAGRTVPHDQLIAALWSDGAPDTALGQLHTLVWRLRGLIGEIVVTQSGGYRLDAGEVDADRFADGVARAAQLAEQGRLDEAAQAYEAALALWRGPAYADVELPGDGAAGLAATVAELHERRLAAERDLIDVRLRLGRHAELVSGLQAMVDAEPLREELRERLMLALYRCGRRAEALALYRGGRELLVRQLGLEPGRSLAALHERMLAADPSLDEWDRPAPRPPVSQLPVDVADFVARAGLVDELALVLTGAGPTPCTVAISGVAGGGKTALAVHVAHLVRDRFPDGQLFVDLRDADPASVLARFLRALGEDVRTIPPDADERAALFRARTAGRRMLVVLDNATGEAQLRPLLPAEPRCAVIVTSRRRLGALAAAHHVDLAAFEPDDALELLRRSAGTHRVAAEPSAAALVVRRCGYLPLAIRIAGARLAARPHLPVARLAEQLADEHARLDVLRTGDLEVRSSLAAGYRTLEAPQQRAFALLGQLDAPDFAAWVASALLDVQVSEAEETLERLVEARLLEVTTGLRYRFHDLVRDYARELAAGQPDADAALDRAFGAWLAGAERAYELLPGGFRRGHVPSAGTTTSTAAVEIGDPPAWCEAERTAVVATVRQAAATGRHELAWALACTSARFFELREHLDDWRTTHEAALRACRAARDDLGEAWVLRSLGEQYLDADRPEQALACLAPALSIFGRLGDRAGSALAFRAQGTAHRLLGRVDLALASLSAAERLCVELGDPAAHAHVLHNLGALHRRENRPARAQECYRRALALFTELGDRFGEAYVQCSLGLVAGPAEAERHLERSVELCREVGYRRGEAIALGHLGELHLRAGAHERAADELRRAVTGCREVGDGPGEAIGLRHLGELYLAQGQVVAARTALRQSVALCASIDLPAERARALGHLGHARLG